MKYISIVLTFFTVSTCFASTAPEGVLVGPLHQYLSVLVSSLPSIGLAIIILTLSIRALLIPLQFYSMKSMKKMELIQPKLAKLKEKFSTDSTKLQQATLKLFRKESVNPLTTILPMLIQIPLFYALFKMLSSSPLVSGSDFLGWLPDLAAADPLYILPVIAGICQLLVMIYSQNKSSDKKMSRGVVVTMSVAFTGFMFTMPSAVLLYSITGSVISLAERAMIARII